MTESPRSTAERWLAAEPDDDIRDELAALIDGGDDELTARFTGRLQFGTAGLRAAVGAGPQRMNRLVVRQAAAGLGAYLLDQGGDAAERGIIVGYDARRKSDVFALDSARVWANMGIRVRLFDQQVPTPVLAWSITQTDSAAGVVVTASHNPPADNGYKVYLGDGAQIVPPHDTGIAACIDRYDPTTVELADEDDPMIEFVGDELVDAYIASVPAVRRRPDVEGVTVAYTAMHGVGGETILRSFEAAGLPAPAVVEAQFEPDGTFPTVSFPNPEEPGAMDLLLETAAAADAHVAIANDPDADRLGAAIRQPDGSWRRLGGDEIGWLFADYILSTTDGDDRLVVTTLVSSALLARWPTRTVCQREAETFTGFKWIARAVHDHPDHRFVFGYEQALGTWWLVSCSTRTASPPRCCSPRWPPSQPRRAAHDAGLARSTSPPATGDTCSLTRRCACPRPRRRRRCSNCAPTRPPTSPGAPCAPPRSTRRPTCCASTSTAASGSRSAPAAPNPR
ncbi:MAG: hypothetical protein R2697_09320 [Ilumatobacteraceae bacterium]